MKTSLPSFRLLLSGGIIALFASTSAQAQLLANWQASTYTGGATWTDSVGGVVATTTGTAVANGGNIGLSGTGFTFNTGNVSGLDGLTNYTVALGFTAAAPTGGGPDFYEGTGIFGADIPGAGQGDSGMGVTTDGGGQLVAGGGVSGGGTANQPGGGDSETYDVQTGNGGSYTTGSATGVVLVFNGTAGTISLYVNGAISPSYTYGQASPGTVAGVVINGLGYVQNTGVESFSYGIGELASNNGNGITGDITQFQIYAGAENATAAAALSSAIALQSAVPEPSTYALMVLGVGMLLWGARRRSVI